MSGKTCFSPEEVVRLSNKILKTFCAAWLGLTFAGCATEEPVAAEEVTSTSEKNGTDIQQALTALGSARVVGTHEDGIPSFIEGNLGQASRSVAGLTATDAKASVQTALTSIGPVFRLSAENLVYTRSTVDQNGHEHLRFAQLKGGVPVLGGELILHVDRAGNIYAANASARDGQGQGNALAAPRISADAAGLAAINATGALKADAKAERLVYVRDSNGQLVLAQEVRVRGEREDGFPVHTLVYVKASDGSLVLEDSQIHTAKNRKVYSANNGSSTPGTLKRSEGQAAIGDAHVDMNYDMLGLTYDCYNTLFGRDSYDNAGAQLISTVHYGNNYVNAYWDGTQMVYGDGDGVNSIELGKDLDVTVHELSHAVTDVESNLIY
ncbi:MAG: peptidase M4, partial [Myxococcaceae bacterium]|nr:peptidase M4 [Myxococcaceae bacterium]